MWHWINRCVPAGFSHCMVVSSFTGIVTVLGRVKYRGKETSTLYSIPLLWYTLLNSWDKHEGREKKKGQRVKIEHGKFAITKNCISSYMVNVWNHAVCLATDLLLDRQMSVYKCVPAVWGTSVQLWLPSQCCCAKCVSASASFVHQCSCGADPRWPELAPIAY